MKVLKGPERLRAPNKTRSEAEKLRRNSLQESGSCRGRVWKRAVTQWLGGEEKLFVRRLQTTRSFTQQSLGHRGEESPRHCGTTAHLRAAKRRRGCGPALQRGAAKVGDRFISSRFPTRSGGKQSGSSRSWARARARGGGGGRSPTGEAARRTSGYNLQNKSSAELQSKVFGGGCGLQLSYIRNTSFPSTLPNLLKLIIATLFECTCPPKVLQNNLLKKRSAFSWSFGAFR